MAASAITADQETFGKAVMRVVLMLNAYTSVGSVIQGCIGREGNSRDYLAVMAGTYAKYQFP